MRVKQIDHIVLTVSDIGATSEFYCRVLGMREIEFGNDRKALAFGSSKINLHLAGKELEPRALRPAPGSTDLCFITELSLPRVIDHIKSCGVTILEGPVRRSGALGPINSIYLRDPDGNLIEIANYL